MKDRMDFNEADHPRDENGQFAEGRVAALAPPKTGLRYLPKAKMLRAKGLQIPKRKPFISPSMALSSDSRQKMNTKRLRINSCSNHAEAM